MQLRTKRIRFTLKQKIQSMFFFDPYKKKSFIFFYFFLSSNTIYIYFFYKDSYTIVVNNDTLFNQNKNDKNTLFSILILLFDEINL